jgi:iron complex outermembrane recepter protein
MTNIRKLALAGVSIWSLAAPGMVMAQGAAEGASSDDGIIVMARRRGEDIQEVPMVVQAVTAQELNELNIRQFEDIETLVPGLQMSENANGIGTTTTLRGIAFDVNASGNNGTVEFYYNDSPISAGVLFQSLFDVGQIEVLRGPQGTLRGRASPSGSITVTSRRPDLSEPGGYLNGTLNDLGGWNLNGAINVPIVQDIFALRVAGVVDESDGDEVRSINSSIEPFAKNRAIRVSALLEPFDALSLFGSYTRANREFQQFTHLESLSIADPSAPDSPVLIRAKDRLAAEGVPPHFEQDFEIFNWQGELRFFGQKLNYVGSHTKQKLRSQGRGDTGGVFATRYPTITDLQTYGQFSATDSKVTAHEIRLSSDERIGGIFEYIVGYFNQKSDVETNLLTPFPLFLPLPFPPPNDLFFITVISPTVYRPSGTREESFFAHVTAHVTDSTEIAAGARRITYQNRAALLVNGAEVPAGRVTFEDSKESTWIYSASISHRFSPSFLAYASFGTSWRPGGDTNAIILRDVAMPSPALAGLYFPDDEKSESFEVGIKTDLLDRRLRFNLTGYYQKFDNYAFFARNVYFGGPNAQGTNSVFQAVGIAVGVPAKVWGLEAEIAFQPTPSWDLAAVLAYSKSKISNATIPCNDYFPNDGVPDSVSTVPTFAQLNAASNGDGVTFCNVTQRAGLTPPFTATLQSEYSLPVGSSKEAYIRGLMTYYGNSQNDPSNPIDDIKSHAIVNLFAGLRADDGAWELGVYAKNIFDTFRITERSSTPTTTSFRTLPFFQSSNAVSTYRTVSVTAPQEFGVTFRAAIGSR